MGQAAVLDYIASHAVQEGEQLPPDWDATLAPALEELGSQLGQLGLNGDQLEAATQQIVRRLCAQQAGARGEGSPSEEDSEGSGSGTGSSGSE